MAPRSPISASVADWLSSARAYFACADAVPGDDGPLQYDSGASFGPLAGTLVRIQARYSTLNARIQREADRLALWLLAKVHLPAGVADLLVEGLSSEGQGARAAGYVPKFRLPEDGNYSLLDLTADGQALAFDDETADDVAYDSVHIVPYNAERSRSTLTFRRPA